MCSDAQSHVDQSNRDIGTVKFRANSLTLRANVDVYSLETVRSPALMWIFKPGVAPLSRAYPRLINAVPSGLPRRFATKRTNKGQAFFVDQRLFLGYDLPPWDD